MKNELATRHTCSREYGRRAGKSPHLAQMNTAFVPPSSADCFTPGPRGCPRGTAHRRRTRIPRHRARAAAPLWVAWRQATCASPARNRVHAGRACPTCAHLQRRAAGPWGASGETKTPIQTAPRFALTPSPRLQRLGRWRLRARHQTKLGPLPCSAAVTAGALTVPRSQAERMCGRSRRR